MNVWCVDGSGMKAMFARNSVRFARLIERKQCENVKHFCQVRSKTTNLKGILSSLQKSDEQTIVGQDLSAESKLLPITDPLCHEDYFGVRNLVDLETLFENRCHYGHHVKCRNQYMTPYLFGSRFNVDIIDLEKTVPLFQDALNVVANIAYRRGIILFVSRQKMTMPIVEETAKQCGEYAHCRYWNPGTFTDSTNVFGYQARLPDLCIFLHTQNSVFESHRAVSDSAKLLIPTVGVVDSNCDPRLITYPIPGNDDTVFSVSYYLKLFKTAILKGKQQREIDLGNEEKEE